MLLNGDPTLHLFPGTDSEPYITITKPDDAIYVKDNKLMSFFTPTIIGEITIETCITNDGYEINHVDFFVDEELISTDNESPYECLWDEKIFGQHTLKVIAYDNNKNETTDEVEIMILNLDIL